jgi:hypothetical protein
MDLGRILKWLAVIVIAVALWKVALPKLQSSTSTSKTTASAPSGVPSCALAARQASEKWGSGVGQFVNPPYDLNEWSSFTAEVESSIREAEEECRCSATACGDVRESMHELRALVSDLDRSIRNGSSPPTDIVQRQERLDNRIEAAANAE